MKYSALFLLASSLLVAGCIEALVEPRSEGIWPMGEGDCWIGIREYYDMRGNLLGSKPDTISILYGQSIEGEMWYEFNNGTLRTNRGDGVWARIPSSNGEDYVAMIGKYPASRGDTFETSISPEIDLSGPTGDTLLFWREVLSTDSALTVPAGTFNCHVYGSFWQSLRSVESPIQSFQSYAFSPKVGPVIITDSYIATGVSHSDTAYSQWKLVEVITPN